jgi:dipeptidyl aminopeptidase/acylaminoacyl peptidase
VVACHGLGASKDGDKYVLMADVFPRAGLALARFDFRGCGEASGHEAETTVGTRIEDARAILRALEGTPRLDGRFGLLGSSLGGFVALHVVAERADPTPLVTWNAPLDLTDLPEPDEGSALGVAFMTELASHRYARAPRGIPRHRVIHSQLDDVVPLAHGIGLHGRAGEPCDLVVITGGDHRLSDPGHRQEALVASLDWFGKFF